jgi:N,N'-diacetyllegionaminate synthase
MRPSLRSIGSREVGTGAPCFVMASVASAHEGSADMALRMIEAGFKMGADGLLFQVYRAQDLVVRRHPDRKELDALELRPKEWKRILEAARASGLPVVVEPLDRASLELAVEAGADVLQVHGTDVENPELVRAFTETKRPVLLSLGGVAEKTARETLDALEGPVGLVHGLPSGPAALEELRLRELAALKERYRVTMGLLDQTDGGSAFALLAPALAAVMGADFVEKRFTLDRTRKGYDYEAALSPEDFYRMVELLRQAERAMGDAPGTESEGAQRTRRGLARSIVAGSLIKRGEVLTEPMLAFKRTDARQAPGLAPREAHRVIGRRAARPIEADETIREDMLE